MSQVNSLLTGDQFDFHCHSNLTRAILPYNLMESDVHDVLNVFQVTGLDSMGRYFMRPSPAIAGSYIEFFAEIDLLCALSTCPGGDLSIWGWAGGEFGRMQDTCRPIEVSVWKISPECFARRPVLQGPTYHGMHGLILPG